jgi:hypothetical protein
MSRREGGREGGREGLYLCKYIFIINKELICLEYLYNTRLVNLTFDF